METIKFKKSDWIVVAIVIVLIIAIAIIAFNASKKEDRNETEEQEKKNRLTIFIQRWQKLIDQISIEIKTLKLTQEMEAMLERKIANYIIIAKIMFFMIFLILATLFYANGIDIATSILNTAGILSIFFFGGSLLIANRFTEPNVVVESFIQWVRKSVYKKYDYDPALIPVLEESINHKEIEATEILLLVQTEQL
jgi:Flp pilus assembly protein TadB